ALVAGGVIAVTGRRMLTAPKADQGTTVPYRRFMQVGGVLIVLALPLVCTGLAAPSLTVAGAAPRLSRHARTAPKWAGREVGSGVMDEIGSGRER
ncbi:MAG: hypothetical protein ACRD0Q_11515, partial [Acidimicrobiales bacterium]